MSCNRMSALVAPSGECLWGKRLVCWSFVSQFWYCLFLHAVTVYVWRKLFDMIIISDTKISSHISWLSTWLIATLTLCEVCTSRISLQLVQAAHKSIIKGPITGLGPIGQLAHRARLLPGHICHVHRTYFTARYTRNAIYIIKSKCLKSLGP